MPVPVAAALAGSSFGKQLLQGAAQTGSSGLISGALGQLFGSMNARRQWKYTQKQMALQQKYALEQMQKQAEYEYGNWQKQFDYENAYNDPSKVFERYRNAGITPAGVLGSSGVGVNATMSGGSAGSVGASGPSGGPGLPGAGPLDMMSLGQNMLTSSERERNNAAARLDRAQAQSIENQTQSPDRYAEAFDLALELSRANVNSEEARTANLQALTTWQEAQNKYADLIATQNWLKIVGECSLITQQNDRIRALNKAQIPLMEKEAAANISYLLALARNLNASASVQEIQYRDYKEWFDVNWTTPIDVQEINEKGEPTGKTKKMTGKDIALYLNGLQYTVGQQGVVSEGFMNWQRKHPLLMSVTERVAGGVAAAAAMRIGSKSRGSVGGTRESYEEYYGDDGVLKGVKVGQYRNIPLKY